MSEDRAMERRVLEHLRRLDATFTTIPCDPELADTAAFCAHYGYPPERSANTIVVATKRPPGRFAACLVLATQRLDVNHRVRDLLEVRKLSFASAEQTVEVTGMRIGGVTMFGLPDELPRFVDAAVMDLDRVIVGGGSRALKIEVDPEVFPRMGARVVAGLGVPR